MTIAALLLLALQGEARFEEWIRQLADDSPAVRQQAFDRLVEAGATAEKALQKAKETAADVEVRAQVGRVLDRLEWTRAFDPGPSRITLRAEGMSLREVLAELQKQGRTGIDVKRISSARLDGRVSASFEGTPLFQAVDDLCRRHGGIHYSVRSGWDRDSLIALGEGRGFEGPRVLGGSVGMRLESIACSEVRPAGGGPREETEFSFTWFWEKGVRPLGARVELAALADGAGASYLDRAKPDTEQLSMHHVDTDFAVKVAAAPPEDVSTFSLIKGDLVVVFPEQVEELVFGVAEREGVEKRAGDLPIKVTKLTMVGTTLKTRVEIGHRDALGRIKVHLFDTAGKEIEGWRTLVHHGIEESAVEIRFTRAEGAAEPKELRCRVAAGRVERKVPFEFRDVRFR